MILAAAKIRKGLVPERYYQIDDLLDHPIERSVPNRMKIIDVRRDAAFDSAQFLTAQQLERDKRGIATLLRTAGLGIFRPYRFGCEFPRELKP
jgi:hypothetical protein